MMARLESMFSDASSLSSPLGSSVYSQELAEWHMKGNLLRRDEFCA